MEETTQLSATAKAFAALKRDILDAALEPHQHYLEGALAERLGMSRTPVREACIRLQAEGLVEMVPRRGIKVVGFSARDMAEVYDLLATLESRAAELAVDRASAADLDDLDEAIAGMQRAINDNDLLAWAAADAEFHRRLVRASGNRHLTRAANQYADLVSRARLLTVRLRDRPSQSVADRRDLVAAIRDGDGKRASEMHRMHRRLAAATLIELLESLRLNGI